MYLGVSVDYDVNYCIGARPSRMHYGVGGETRARAGATRGKTRTIILLAPYSPSCLEIRCSYCLLAYTLYRPLKYDIKLVCISLARSLSLILAIVPFRSISTLPGPGRIRSPSNSCARVGRGVQGRAPESGRGAEASRDVPRD